MSVTYVIASEDDTFRLDTEFYVHELKKRWPNPSIHLISDPKATSLLQWHIDPDEFFMLGDFSEQGVSFIVASLSAIAQFARWYRMIVPSNYKLILYKTSLEYEPIEVTQDMTESDLIAGFNTPFNMDKYE